MSSSRSLCFPSRASRDVSSLELELDFHASEGRTNADDLISPSSFRFVPWRFRDVSIETPFPLENPPTYFIHTTYLDSLGRPAIKILKSLCTEKCGEDLVYVRSLSSPSRPSFARPPHALTASLSFCGGKIHRSNTPSALSLTGRRRSL